MPAGPGQAESAPGEGAWLAAASAGTPSHKPCVVAVRRGVGPISQPGKLRPARARASPAAQAQQRTLGERLLGAGAAGSWGSRVSQQPCAAILATAMATICGPFCVGTCHTLCAGHFSKLSLQVPLPLLEG